MFVFIYFGVWLSPVERLVRDDVEMPFLAQNQQKPYKIYSQIVQFWPVFDGCY